MRTIADWDVRAIIEGLLFVANQPLSASDIANVLLAEYEENAEEAPTEVSAEPANADTENDAVIRRELIALVEQAFSELVASYQDEARSLGRGFELIAVAGGYQLRTRPLAGTFIRRFLQAKPTRLSRAQLETLAIIAYRQPVTKPEIEHIRGVDCGAGLRTLLERKLIRILGKKEEVGRPLLYGTSKEFLEFFRLGSLVDLPTLREFQELSDEHKRRVEEAIDQEAPLGSFQDLADAAPKLDIEDAEMLSSLDDALAAAKSTVQRVAEITGLGAAEEAPVEPTDSVRQE